MYKLILFFFISFILLIILIALNRISYNKEQHFSIWMSHSRFVIKRYNLLDIDLRSALIYSPKYANSIAKDLNSFYKVDLESIEATISETKKLVAYNKQEVIITDSIQGLIKDILPALKQGNFMEVALRDDVSRIEKLERAQQLIQKGVYVEETFAAEQRIQWRDSSHSTNLLALVIALFAVCILVATFFSQFSLSKKNRWFKKQLMNAQIEVQEHTYRQIGKELHDNVGQLLSTTKMLMGVMEVNVSPVPETLGTANETLGKAIKELRLLSRSLDKDWLEQFSFLENLENEVRRINESGIIVAQVLCNTDIKLKPDEQLILFRIVQEAIHNAIRHGNPTHVDILIIQEEGLIIKVSNDGKTIPQNFHGMGTTNMRHRVSLFGGSITWQSLPETVVTVTIPLKQIQRIKWFFAHDH